MERYVCIHGHFYQPPRENPWLEAIEIQDSAYPYHDWNARIEAECYGQNGASRILDDEGRIESIVNNYSRISFNFGPTLLSWLQEQAPGTYEAILAADRESRDRFSGHGSALAQAYNHMILPLANPRDRQTQVEWGVRDFEHRFGRKPEGMWLPECAVDTETLEALAAAGIRFTVLSPYQVARVRKKRSRSWRDATGANIDPSMAYEQRLPSGRRIALFFYDGPVSQAVAFERLLISGERFADRILGGFSDERTWPQLMHIATDGESYGHHHRHGDMALAYALQLMESDESVRLTNYGEFLERHPPTHEVEVLENSSWSCIHGVERWRSNCGCNSGGRPQWDQEWREPLRDALDWLRDTVAPLYVERAGRHFQDPWQARGAWIDVILDRSPENIDAFLEKHGADPADPDGRVESVKLLELQRHAMLMYTSCGWFFDELSGIETVQVIDYAARCLQLARDLFGDDLEGRFLEHLGKARSNLPEPGNGKALYERWVRPKVLDLRRVGAHYAVSSLFEDYPERAEIYCFEATRLDQKRLTSGRMRLGTGRFEVRSRITTEAAILGHAVLHFGDHNVSAGIRIGQSPEEYEGMAREVLDAFQMADVSELIRAFDRCFDGTYTLRSLFRDEQRKLVGSLVDSAIQDADSLYGQIYEQNAPLMLFLTHSGIPLPRALHLAAERALNHRLEEALRPDELNRERVASLLQEARDRSVTLDTATLEYGFRRSLVELAERVVADPESLEGVATLQTASDLLPELPFETDAWEVQNIYWKMSQEHVPEVRARADQGDEAAREWLERFTTIGERLRVRPE